MTRRDPHLPSDAEIGLAEEEVSDLTRRDPELPSRSELATVNLPPEELDDLTRRDPELAEPLGADTIDVPPPDLADTIQEHPDRSEAKTMRPADGLGPNAVTRKEAAPPGQLRSTSGRLRSSRGSLRSSGRFSLGGVEDEPPELFAGKYALLGEIARGGMGVVYKANQIDLNRVIALKVMLSGALASDEDKQRFIREANASARLQHPNIVGVYDIGEIDDNLFFTMDYVEGKPLADKKRDYERAQLLEIMIKVCDAVGYANERNIIHRDLKPANIMINGDDEPLVMDFGLAKQVEVIDETGAPSLLTREGSVMGTPHYMPPEQAQGFVSEIDVRSDVYALGVIAYELWTGRLPFEAPTLTKLIFKILDDDPLPPRQIDPTIDWDMEAIILKAIEKPKHKRYQTALELKQDLVRMRDGLTILARRATVLYRVGKWSRRNRRSLAIAGLIVAMGVLSIGFAVYKSQESQRLAAERFEDQLERARAAQVGLAADAEQLLAQLGAYWGAAGAFDARRGERGSALAGEAEALLGRLSAVEEGLRPYVAERERAGDARGATEATETLAQLGAEFARLGEARQALETLGRVHADLSRADTDLTSAAALGSSIQTALQSGGSWAPPAAATLEEAEASFKEQLALSKEGAWNAGAAEVTSGGVTGDLARLAGLTQRIETVAFGVIGRVGEVGQRLLKVTPSRELTSRPEQARAEEIYRAAGEVRARVDKAQEEARRLQLAQAMLVMGGRLLDLLEAEAEQVKAGVGGPGGPGRGADERELDRLSAAGLAKALIQRGLEAQQTPELLEARYRANRTYAEVLLASKAYKVFDAELRAEEAFRPRDLAELRGLKESALKETKALEEELKEHQTLGALKLAELAARVERLRALETHPAMNVELERLRRAAHELASAALATRKRVLAQEAVKSARDAAEAAEASVADDQLADALSDLLAGWETVKSVLEVTRDLEARERAEGLRACEIRRAALLLRGAQAWAKSDAGRALTYAGQAVKLYEALSEDPSAVPPVPKTRLEGAQRALARLKQESQRPEGMVLIRRRVDVELGGGPQDRNEARTVTIEPFYLALREVTNAEYAEFVQAPEYGDDGFWRRLGTTKAAVATWPEGWGRRLPPEGREELPVTGISWSEARGYAAFRGMRLPSDAEWEYVARYDGGALRAYPWGNVFEEGRLESTLRPPGTNPRDVTPASRVFDLGGNVSEWVVLHTGSEDQAAVRGASYLYPTARIARGEHRLSAPKDYRGPQLGLRLARSVR